MARTSGTRLVSVAKLGNAFQLLVLVPKGRRIVAQGGASDDGHTRNPGETEAVMSAPEGATELSMIRTYGQAFRRPFQGSPPVVFSHPGFCFASPWAMILTPFQG